MKRDSLLKRSNNRALLLMVVLSCISAPALLAQLSSKVEKSLDDYMLEIVKVYQIVESEEVNVALQKIDDLRPSIEKKARILADLAENDPEILEILDDDHSIELFQDKTYFQELMRIVQSKDFHEKLESSKELQLKIEEVENIIEDYTKDIGTSPGEPSELSTGMAFSITLNGKGKFAGTYNIVTDFEEGAIAYIDDLDYLRIEINGEVDGQEAIVSFFVENTGPGHQDWETEGHFVFELMDSEGDLIVSLWGSEEMGHFNIVSVDGPGGYVTGTIHGECMDGDGNSDAPIPISASFKVRYLKDIY